MINKVQIYAGYGLALLLTLLFCLACRLWSRAKINHTFIFEFDTRNHQDWRQLVEVGIDEASDVVDTNITLQIPCFFLFLLGFFMWLNFSHFSFGAMYLYYPVILIGLSVLILFLPFPILYHRSRLWFLYSVVSITFAVTLPRSTNGCPVAAAISRFISCRVPRLLPRRHVLFSHIHLRRK